MIDETNTSGEKPGRTRPYTWPEVLRAVAHVLSRPDGPRHTPDVQHYDMPQVVVSDHHTGQRLVCADALAWARVMDHVDSVEFARHGDYVQARVTGVIAAGPTVEVLLFLDPELFPIALQAQRSLRIPVEELAVLAAQQQPADVEDQAVEPVLASVR